MRAAQLQEQILLELQDRRVSLDAKVLLRFLDELEFAKDAVAFDTDDFARGWSEGCAFCLRLFLRTIGTDE